MLRERGVKREVGRREASLSLLSFHSRLTLKRKPLCEHFQPQQTLGREMLLLEAPSPLWEGGVQVRLHPSASGCLGNLGAEVITQAHRGIRGTGFLLGPGSVDHPPGLDSQPQMELTQESYVAMGRPILASQKRACSWIAPVGVGKGQVLILQDFPSPLPLTPLWPGC